MTNMTELNENDMPGGYVQLTERISGAGWNRKGVTEKSGTGEWKANDAGNVNDPDSMVSIEVFGASFSWYCRSIKRTRTDVERMFEGDGALIEKMFKEAAALASSDDETIEVMHVERIEGDPDDDE